MSKEIEKMTAIYEKHKNTMYAVALKILKNPQDAEDAVHNLSLIHILPTTSTAAVCPFPSIF